MQSTPNHRVSRASFILTGVLLSSAWGCAHLPKTGIESTGEPLNVEFHTETHTYSTQAKVGEVVNKDSSGRVVGTSDVYETRTGTYDVQKWQVFQGDTPIDDQDFFRIGGDIDSAKEIAASRQSGMTMNKIGLGLLIGGGAAALAGIGLSYALAPTPDPVTGATPAASKVPYGLMTAGLITVSVGGILTWVGIAKVKREHPIDDPDRANAVARKYNKSIGAGAAPAKDEEEEEEPKPKPKKKKKKKKAADEDEE